MGGYVGGWMDGWVGRWREGERKRHEKIFFCDLVKPI